MGKRNVKMKIKAWKKTNTKHYNSRKLSWRKKYLKLYIERVYRTLDNGDPKLPISSHTQVK